MSIRVRFLKNHGCVVTRAARYGKPRERFERPSGDLSVTEAAVALKVNEMRLYRLIEDGRLKTRDRMGEHRIALSDIRRMKKNPRLLERPRRVA